MGWPLRAALPAALLWAASARAYTVGVMWPSSTSDEQQGRLDLALQAALAGHRTALSQPSLAVNFLRVPNVTNLLAVDRGVAQMLGSGDLVGIIAGGTVSAERAGVTASRLQVPVLVPSVVTAELAHLHASSYPFVVYALPDHARQAGALLALVRELSASGQIDISRLGVIASRDDYGTDIAQAFLTQAMQAGVRADIVLTVGAEAMQLSAAAFDSQYLRILATRSTQCILLLASAATAAFILRRSSPEYAGRVWIAGESVAGDSLFDGADEFAGLLAVRPRGFSTADLGSFAVDWAGQAGWVQPDLEVRAAYASARALLAAVASVSGLAPHTGSCGVAGAPWGHGPAVLAAVGSLTAPGAAWAFPSRAQGAAVVDWDVVNLQRSGLSVAWHEVGNITQGGNISISKRHIAWTAEEMPSSEELLRGRRLHILFVEDPRGIPMCLNSNSTSATIRKSYDTQCRNQFTQLCGLIPDLIARLSDSLGFSYTWESQVGGWGGAMQRMADGSEGFDMVASSSPVTPEREAIVDFAFPYLTTSYALFVKPQPTQESMWRFLRPFNWEVWAVFAACLVIFSFFFYGLENRHNAYINSKRGIYKNDEFGGVGNSVWFSFSSLFAVQDGAPRTHAGRLASAGYFFVTFMFAATYTAELLVFLQSQTSFTYAVESVNDFQGIGTDEDESIGTVPLSGLVVDGGGVYESWVLANSNNATGYQIASGALESFFAVANGSAFATIYFKMYATYAREVTNCEIDLAPHSLVGNLLGVGLALPQGSIFTAAISNAIVQFQAEGWIEKTQKRWLSSSLCTSLQQHEAGEVDEDVFAGGMGIESISGVFVVFGCFIFGAALLRLSRFVVLPYLPEAIRELVQIETVEEQEERHNAEIQAQADAIRKEINKHGLFEGGAGEEEEEGEEEEAEEEEKAEDLPEHADAQRQGSFIGPGQPIISPAPPPTPEDKPLGSPAPGEIPLPDHNGYPRRVSTAGSTEPHSPGRRKPPSFDDDPANGVNAPF